jgi:hypothetical protein
MRSGILVFCIGLALGFGVGAAYLVASSAAIAGCSSC